MKYAIIQNTHKMNATIEAPSSKSFTNRALIVASLANGASTIRNGLISEDIELLINALMQCGIQITVENHEFKIIGRCGRIGMSKDPILLGNSGTGLRFMTSLVALGHGTYRIDGDQRMHERPILDLVEALQGLGVKINSLNGYPPIEIEAQGLVGGKISLNTSKSSQYLSSLLMVAPYAKNPVEVQVKDALVSAPYVQMTLQIMHEFGVEVQHEGLIRFSIPNNQKYIARQYSVEADASNASYFFAAAAITQGNVCISNLPATSTQGDLEFVKLLRQMGCSVIAETNGITIKGNPLKGIHVSMKDMPDMVPTLAICALNATGTTTIEDIAHLRIKETDRLYNLAIELRKIGAVVETTDSSMTIEPPAQMKPAQISTYDDHRMAMSFAVAGLNAPGLKIENPDCVRKSYPNFWEKYAELGAEISFEDAQE